MELKRMTRQEIGRVSQRAQMILLSAQQRTVPEIAAIFAVSGPTVRYWIGQFNLDGPAGLYDEPRCGRPRKIPRGDALRHDADVLVSRIGRSSTGNRPCTS
jgi:hypothetical protein